MTYMYTQQGFGHVESGSMQYGWFIVQNGLLEMLLTPSWIEIYSILSQ
jgi:hypothetical protein